MYLHDGNFEKCNRLNLTDMLPTPVWLCVLRSHEKLLFGDDDRVFRMDPDIFGKSAD
jgi:hypothetical protein